MTIILTPNEVRHALMVYVGKASKDMSPTSVNDVEMIVYGNIEGKVGRIEEMEIGINEIRLNF